MALKGITRRTQERKPKMGCVGRGTLRDSGPTGAGVWIENRSAAVPDARRCRIQCPFEPSTLHNHSLRPHKSPQFHPSSPLPCTSQPLPHVEACSCEADRDCDVKLGGKIGCHCRQLATNRGFGAEVSSIHAARWRYPIFPWKLCVFWQRWGMKVSPIGDKISPFLRPTSLLGCSESPRWRAFHV